MKYYFLIIMLSCSLSFCMENKKVTKEISVKKCDKVFKKKLKKKKLHYDSLSDPFVHQEVLTKILQHKTIERYMRQHGAFTMPTSVPLNTLYRNGYFLLPTNCIKKAVAAIKENTPKNIVIQYEPDIYKARKTVDAIAQINPKWRFALIPQSKDDYTSLIMVKADNNGKPQVAFFVDALLPARSNDLQERFNLDTQKHPENAIPWINCSLNLREHNKEIGNNALYILTITHAIKKLLTDRPNLLDDAEKKLDSVEQKEESSKVTKRFKNYIKSYLTAYYINNDTGHQLRLREEILDYNFNYRCILMEQVAADKKI